MRILIYILVAICSVACMAATEPADPRPQPDPKPDRPVQPIKRRPITPDGTVWRPRYTLVVDFDCSIMLNGNYGSAYSMSVEVYSVTTGRTFSAVLRYEGDALTIPRELLGQEFIITTECDGIIQVELCTIGEE